jgi:hypothetical protein
VAGYPGGSADIEASASRVQGFTTDMKDKYGVEIVGTIEELCQKVDGVMLESVDGRPHLEQVRPVLAAKKPVFIDKPVAGSLSHVLEIFRLAKEAGVPCWSSSSLRYTPSNKGVKSREEVGDIPAAMPSSPCSVGRTIGPLLVRRPRCGDSVHHHTGPSPQRVQMDGYEYVVGSGRAAGRHLPRAARERNSTMAWPGSKGIVRLATTWANLIVSVVLRGHAVLRKTIEIFPRRRRR